jgi:hypothetical protein
LIAWSGWLRSGTLSRLQVVEAIWASPEHFTNEVADFYYTLLNRPPDANGLQSWVQALEDGMPEEQVAFRFLSSPESLGKGDKYFVDHMYSSLLGRPAEAAGEASWLNVLGDDDSGNPTHPATETHAQVVNGFLYSQESLIRVVDGYYQVFLQRMADPAGQSAWVVALGQGESFLTASEWFLSSDEFYDQAAAQG